MTGVFEDEIRQHTWFPDAWHQVRLLEWQPVAVMVPACRDPCIKVVNTTAVSLAHQAAVYSSGSLV